MQGKGSKHKEFEIIEMALEPTQSSKDLTAKKPEQVFPPEFIPVYTQLHHDIWHRLIRIDASTQILETIGRYPLDNLYAPQDNIFWRMVFWNFTHMSVILLHTLICDNTKGAHTLLTFKNAVRNNLLTDSLKSEYTSKLRATRLAKRLAPLREKIADMRHHVVAHRLLDAKSRLKQPVLGKLTLPQLREVFEDVRSLFNACSFGAEYCTTFYPPPVPGHQPRQKDIEQILDLVVKHSFWLNEPERRAPFWKLTRKCLPPQQIEQLNHWRRKFGMPDA